MKILKIITLVSITVLSYGQTSIDFALSSDILTYKFKNTSDPYLTAALHVSDVSASGFIKEGTIGYSRIYNTDNIVAGGLLGKQIKNWTIRSGVKIIGFLDLDASTDVLFHVISGYQVTKTLSLHAQYSWMPTSSSFHTFGISSFIKLKSYTL